MSEEIKNHVQKMMEIEQTAFEAKLDAIMGTLQKELLKARTFTDKVAFMTHYNQKRAAFGPIPTAMKAYDEEYKHFQKINAAHCVILEEHGIPKVNVFDKEITVYNEQEGVN